MARWPCARPRRCWRPSTASWRPSAPRTILGAWQAEDDGSLAASAVGRNAVVSLGAMPEECLIETRVTYQGGTGSYGLLLRADAAYDSYYQVRLEPANQRMVIDRWPRPGDEPFMLERPLALTEGQPVTLKVIASGTNLVVYASSDEREWTALSCRMYDHRSGGVGIVRERGAGAICRATSGRREDRLSGRERGTSLSP